MRFQMTALIDVVFILLMYWVAAAEFEPQDVSNAINLPAYVPTPLEVATDPPPSLTVEIGPDRVWSIDGTSVSRGDYRSRLAEMVERHQDNFLLTIRADADVRHGDPISALRIAQQLGIQRFNLPGRPDESGAGE